MKNQGDGKGIIGEERGKKLLFNFVDSTCRKKHSFLFSSVRMCLIVKLNHFFRTDVSVSLGCGDA